MINIFLLTSDELELSLSAWGPPSSHESKHTLDTVVASQAIVRPHPYDLFRGSQGEVKATFGEDKETLTSRSNQLS
jgi:hypothetical protein